MKREFDFSAQLSDCGVKPEALKTIANVGHVSTIYRWRNGQGGPSVDELKRWANSPNLPLAFREQCANVVAQPATVDERDALDIDRDGKITPKDATVFRCHSHIIAGQRQLHFHAALADGILSPIELAEQQRQASEERHLNTLEMRVLELSAGQRLIG